MSETADVIVIGAGVQGAALAFHLARRGASVIVVERSVVAGEATGRSSGFVRMHYDLESEARLAWAAYPYFARWDELVGEGTCGFTRTGFVQLVPPHLADALRANVKMHQRIGIPTSVIGPAALADLVPGMITEDVVAAAFEPESGYADPAMTANGLVAAARRHGARLVQGCGPASVLVEGDHVQGVETARGRFAAPVVVNAAGAWAAAVARTAGVEIPVEAWRHDTAFFGLPRGRSAGFPIVIDDDAQVYFRPDGREMMLVGLESGNVVGGSPDRPFEALGEATVQAMIDGVCARLPWMVDGTLRTGHGGQDGITPDQRAILGAAGPEGFYLDCGHSGTGFKTAPAVGLCMAELIIDGAATTVDISGYGPERFAAGRELIGANPYGALWR
jgi:sarcosine oxidase, subunit beta